MIRILKNKSKINISPLDPNGRSFLNKPIHRLFLRSEVGSTFIDLDKIWEIPIKEDISKIIGKIIRHFKKYQIKPELDEYCQNLINQLETNKKEYQNILQRGLKAKQKINFKNNKEIEAQLSKAFKRPLNNFQLQAVLHLLNVNNGANFSVPGSGKTAIALAYFYLLKKSKIVNSLLIIGPLSSFVPWESEYTECFGVKPRSLRIAGKSKSERRDIYRFPNNKDLFLINYHTVARDLSKLIQFIKRKKFLVVLDESHYVKNPMGGILADSVLQLANYAIRRLVLTGTPTPNDLSDLWTQITFLWPDMLPLGTSQSYLRELKEEKEEKVLNKVKTQISPLFLRITKEQLKLPLAKFNFIPIEMSPIQNRIYSGVVAKFLSEINESPNDRDSLREWRRARAIRLMQIASNPSLLRKDCDEFSLPALEIKTKGLGLLIDHYSKHEMPGKIIYAISLIKELAEKGKKVIIWTTFIHNIRMLKNHLSNWNPVEIHGGIPYNTDAQIEINRERNIEYFKTNKDCMILIANPAACAESISLHKVCHDSIYLDRSFNGAHYFQSLDRIHRLGLKPEIVTNYYILKAKNSIDDVIDHRLKLKLKRMQNVLGDEIPYSFPGYWDFDLGAEEESDLVEVENHIKNSKHN